MMRNFLTTLLFLLACHSIVAQVQDPIHFPPQSEWVFFHTKNTDSLIGVMKYYFLSDDTLFFREATSQEVVKLSRKDLKTPDFYLGKDYAFANRFYGPNGASANRTSKNDKLDRFYYYYLNAPELKFSKVQPKAEPIAQEIDVEETIQDFPAPLEVSDFIQKSSPNAAMRPQIVLKDGGILYPEHFYFLSDGQLYFGNGIRENVFKVDTIAVAAVIGIEVGENLRLMSSKKYVKRGRGFVVGGLYLGVFNAFVVASSVINEYGEGMSFFASIPTGLVYGALIAEGVKRIQNYKRFKYARYVQIQ